MFYFYIRVYLKHFATDIIKVNRIGEILEFEQAYPLNLRPCPACYQLEE